MPMLSIDRKYEGIAKYPAVTRDISMVVPKTVLAGEIEAVLAQRGGKLLESYRLFDVYEGGQYFLSKLAKGRISGISSTATYAFVPMA